jgi:hypothetical protein
MPTTNPRRMLSSGRRAGPPAPAKRRKPRNAGFGSGKIGNAIMTSTLPSVGGGVGVGLLALQLAKRANMSPAAVAGITAAVGAAGTILAPKGAAQNFFSSIAGLGAGLTAIDLSQKPGAQQQQQKQIPQQHGPEVAHRQATGDYVTRDDLNDALRRAMIEHNEQIAQHIEGAVRNAMGIRVDAPPPPPAYDYEERRDAGEVMREAWHEAPPPEYHHERNAVPHDAEAWHFAPPVEHYERNAGHHDERETWHFAPAAEAA